MADRTRSCNQLESLFIQENIRFAWAIGFPAVPYKKASLALQHATTFTTAGWLTVDAGSPPRLSLASTADQICSKTPGSSRGSVISALEQEISSDRSAAGPWSCVLVRVSNVDEDDVTGMIINSNHSLCDAREAAIFVAEFIQGLSIDKVPEVRQACPHDKLPDWIQLLEQSMEPSNSAVADYLALPGTLVTIQQLLGSNPATVTEQSASYIRGSIDAADQVALKDKCKAHSISVTSVLTTCLLRALAEKAQTLSTTRAADKTCLATSILVDLRRFLPTTIGISMAIGTVVVGLRVADLCPPELEGSLLEHLLSCAATVQEQMMQRVRRGEACRNALAISQQRYADAGHASSVEFSNHGVYPVPLGMEVHLSQRYDGFKGMSVLSHSDGVAGAMKLLLSAGQDVDGAAAQRVLDRFAELVREFSSRG